MAGLTLAPSVDQPTVSSSSVGSGAAPTIVGSPGWLREKRVGVSEVAAGAAQTSTAALDLTGSTRFRYPGLPSGSGYAANAGQYVNSDLKPGASSQSAYWPFNVEFVTSSPTVEIRLNAPVANPGLGRILVNGLPITDSPGNATATAGGGYAIKLAFPDSRPRTITLIALNNTVGRFGGVAVESGYTVTKPTDTITRIAIIGDSYVNGATPVGIVDTFAWRLASILGYGRNVILAGIGGTGYQTAIGSDSNSLFVNRVATVMAMAPDIVILEGGRNDPSAGQQAAAEAVIDAILGLGSPTIILSNSSSNGTQAAVNSAMQAAAASRGVIWMPQDVDSLAKIADNVHPTLAGHIVLADAFAASMAPGSTPATGTAGITITATGAAFAQAQPNPATISVTGTASAKANASGAAGITITASGAATAGGGGGSPTGVTVFRKTASGATPHKLYIMTASGPKLVTELVKK